MAGGEELVGDYRQCRTKTSMLSPPSDDDSSTLP